jgi:hypothetical protein
MAHMQGKNEMGLLAKANQRSEEGVPVVKPEEPLPGESSQILMGEVKKEELMLREFKAHLDNQGDFFKYFCLHREEALKLYKLGQCVDYFKQEYLHYLLAFNQASISEEAIAKDIENETELLVEADLERLFQEELPILEKEFKKKCPKLRREILKAGKFFEEEAEKEKYFDDYKKQKREFLSSDAKYRIEAASMVSANVAKAQETEAILRSQVQAMVDDMVS